ncbi:MAG: hypothetical protein E7378_00410 [Clostridiales bacterium]|nr:hypothetical protein [Clostridiales bacterium]
MKKYKLVLISSIIVILIACSAIAVYFFGFYFPEKQKNKEIEQIFNQYYQTKLSIYQTENENYDDYQVDVAFLGDSLTDGYDLSKYYPQYTTANRGIGGDTSFGLENRLQISLYDLKPKVAVILIGGNNLNTMFENYERMLQDIKNKSQNTKIILCSLTAMGKDWANKNQLAAYNNVIIKKLAIKYDYAFVDLFTPLFDEVAGQIYSVYTTDGAHLTSDGYQVLTNSILPQISELIK